MSGFMFFRFEEHFDYDSIKAAYFWHGVQLKYYKFFNKKSVSLV